MSNAKISIHATRRGRDRGCIENDIIYLISIHATRRGRDGAAERTLDGWGVLIHATRRGRDDKFTAEDRARTFQFTRPAGAAIALSSFFPASSLISIHATRRGRDESFRVIYPGEIQFQFTRPAGAAIRANRTTSTARWHFNSRDPQGPRCDLLTTHLKYVPISIHATRRGRDASILIF